MRSAALLETSDGFIIRQGRPSVLPPGVSVTLVEPHGPVNVGHIARLMRNFGVEKLYLVDPKVDLSVAAVYASHASEVLDRAIVTTFDRVRKENELLDARTAVVEEVECHPKDGGPGAPP